MFRTTQNLTLVLLDSVTPAVLPTQQTITFAQWEDGRIPFQCINDDGTPANILLGALILTVRRNYFDPNPTVISRQATPIDYSVGTGYFPIGAYDTGILVAGYRVDVFYIDQFGKEWQVLPASDFIIAESEFSPSSPVTVPESQLPLAQGPQGFPDTYGVYSNSTTYVPGNGVSYTVAGVTSSYICTVTTLGNVPTNASFWQLLVNGGDVFPSQTGQAGKILGTDGTNVSWVIDPTGLPNQTGNAGKNLTTNGTNAAWAFTDHAALLNLLADDHTQYALLAGRAGGQTLNGGSTGDLVINAGSGAGYLYLATTPGDTKEVHIGTPTSTAVPVFIDGQLTVNGATTQFVNDVQALSDFLAVGTVSTEVGFQRAGGGPLLIGTDGGATAITIGAANLAVSTVGSQVGSRRTVADVSISTALGDYKIAFTSITAARVVTLTAGLNGQALIVKDESGSCSAVNTITLTPASGIIDGVTSIVISIPYGRARVYTDGSNWFTE